MFCFVNSQNTIPTTTVTGCLTIDSAMVVSNSVSIQNNLNVVGDITTPSDIIVGGNQIVTGNQSIGGNFSVTGSSVFSNSVGITNGLFFDNALSTGFTYVAPTGTNTVGNLIFGKQGSGPSASLPACFNTNIGGSFVAPGAFRSYVNSGGVNASVAMFTAPWDGSGIIEVEGNNQGNAVNGLLLNYFCGRNVEICTGSNGGSVLMGNNVRAGKNVQIGNYAPITNTVALNIFTNSDAGLKFNTFNNGLKLILVENPNLPNASAFSVSGEGRTEINTFNASPALTVKGYNGSNYSTGFIVYGDGRIRSVTTNNAQKVFSVENPNYPNGAFSVYGNGNTYIGHQIPLSTGAHQDAKLSVDGKILAKSVYITLANGIWADYVFEKSYRLMPIKELEKYINTYKHLPEIPTATEIENNGLNIAEGTAKLLEKLEEAYLYIIELNKRIELLEKTK